ncbi:probable serine/threonine-protein kinase yakA [Musca vetustissima]|uniref:probable serine/threonine-protein kinase yakA n=1 Tax=Musca vetustissima TaxID=27455 RepID=UPI002AB6A1F0|nr:probable serine/threonine-protein kinase yakA [Musca vetustissima]
MSAVTNTHKINGNLFVSANAATTTTTASSSKTFLHTNPHPSSHQHHQHHSNQLQPSPNSLQQQQQQQQHSTNLKSSSAIGLSKLQAPQQHQRRSFIPSATLQQQHQHITVATSGAVTQPPQANQLQTVATIHQPSTPGQQLHTVQSASSSLAAVAATQTPTTSATAAITTAPSGANTDQLTNPPNRRSFYHLQSLKSATNLKAPAHSIPPRYQPPPQPANTTNNSQQQQHPQHTTGILKNLNSQRLTNGTKTSQGTTNGYTSYFAESQSNGHLGNLKYPPDIPQLSSVYIPDSLKNGSASNSRYLQQKHQQQTNQSQLQQRLRSVNQATAIAANGIAHNTNTNSNGNNNHHSNHTNNVLNGHQSSLTDNQLQQQQQDMLKFVRKSDQDHPSPNASVTSSGTGGITSTAGRLTAEQNRQLQSLINELRALKEQNQRLMDDNQELRDLCCFLDDDRQKGRKLAREWQRFGRYTASVMRQEVAAYQNKLRQLDDKQQELITDNLELKELCLYLDEERAHIAANSLCVNCGASTRNTLRDDGDGSSSSTNADENITALRNYERQLPDLHLRSTLQDQTLQYVRSLERRIQQLEEERLTNNTNTATTAAASLASQQQQQHRSSSQQLATLQQQQQPQQLHQPTNVTTTAVTNHQNQKIATQTSTSSSPSALNDGLVDPISGRPEAVVRALQVLEVREQLERDRLGHLTGNAIDQMDDGEKALVREMCNVVWRKLEASPNGPTTLEPL